jgi:hypothetical protein
VIQSSFSSFSRFCGSFPQGISILLGFCLGFTGLCLPWARGAELGSTNLNCLPHFWAAVERKDRPVNVLVFGDSMADSFRSISCVTMNRLCDRLGIAGYSWNNYRNTTLVKMTNGAEMVEPNGFWFGWHYRLPTGGAVSWETQFSPGGLESDQVGIFYVAHPGGGAMSFSVSIDGRPWTVLTELPGYAPTPTGCYTNFALRSNFHRIRVDGLSGTNVVLSPQLLKARSPGVHAAFMDMSGLDLEMVIGVPASIRSPILAGLSPDLVLWQMKERVNSALSLKLEQCEKWWRQAVPGADLVYISAPFDSRDTNSTWTIDHNSIVRQLALDSGRAYVDCMTPGVSYPWMLERGYMADVSHPNLSGSTFLGNYLWNDLGFFVIGARRHLQWSSGNGLRALEFQTTTGLVYHLEQSPDLRTWQTLSTMAGSGSTIKTNLPSKDLESFFRLRLQPK